MIKRLLITVLIAMACLEWSVGCVSVTKIAYSKPTTSDREWRDIGKNSFATEGVKLLLLPGNMRITRFAGPLLPLFPYWGAYDKSPFRMIIGLYLEMDDINVDPKSVLVAVDKDIRIGPSRLIGPASFQDNCGAGDDPNDGNPIQGEVLASKDSCLVLVFDVAPPPPDRSFSVTIDGLRTRNKPLPPLIVHFGKAESKWLWGFCSTPVLELE